MMIENDVLTYLQADATLDALLGSSASNSKIFPSVAPQNTSGAFIVYESMVGGLAENIDERRISFRIYDVTKASVSTIRERMKVLLDKQDGIQGSITSTTYWIYYSKLVAGSGYVLRDDTQTQTFVEVVEFAFKYRNK